eukprot:3644881-Rhodomonas_salina.1
MHMHSVDHTHAHRRTKHTLPLLETDQTQLAARAREAPVKQNDNAATTTSNNSNSESEHGIRGAGETWSRMASRSTLACSVRSTLASELMLRSRSSSSPTDRAPLSSLPDAPPFDQTLLTHRSTAEMRCCGLKGRRVEREREERREGGVRLDGVDFVDDDGGR